MRTTSIILVILIFTIGSAMAFDERDHRKYITLDDGCLMNNFDLDIDDGTIIINSHGRYSDVVEITDEYELYINDRHIKTDAEQKALLGEFHSKTMDLIEEAKVIGLEGAEIGLKGAKLGMHAVGGVFRLLLPDFDTDDLEDELEREAEKLEAQAEELEIQAEELEDIAEDLEDLADELVQKIPELDELDW